MKPDLNDHPAEWRKAGLLMAFGLALLSSVLRWRHVLPNPVWLAVLAALGCAAFCAWLRPRWFRGCHRASRRLGFLAALVIGWVALIVLFFFVLTPIGLLLRLAGKDPLQLKPRLGAATCWQPARDSGPLDRLF